MSVGYNPYIDAASAQFGVDPQLIRGVIALESSGNPAALSGAGARGLMQVMPPTYAALAQKHGFGADMSDPENSIMAGTAYLSEQLKANGGDWGKALAAYNAGPAGSAKFRATGDFSTLPQETRGYLQRAAQAGLLDPNDTPPAEVADRPAGSPIRLTTTSNQSSTASNGVVTMPSGLLSDSSAQTTAPSPAQQPTAPPGLLSDPDTQAMTLLALGSGLLSGRNWAEGLAGAGHGAMQAMGSARNFQMQKAQRDLQTAELRQKLAQRQTQMQAAQSYADKLDAAGKGDLAAAIRGNPALMDEVVKRQAEVAFPKAEAYTLTPGSKRFGADGRVVAEVPAAESNKTELAQVFDPSTGQTTWVEKADAVGKTAPPPRGVTVNVGGDPGENAAQRQALADSLGVPLADVNPYADPRLSPKGRENLFLAHQKNAEKRWTTMQQQEDTARQRIQDMKRFMELNATTDSGGIYGMSSIGAATKAVAGAFNGDVAEMNAISSRVSRAMRQPGEGSTSDFDAKQFLAATVGIDKPREANNNIANAVIARSQNELDRGAFERAYFDANGHLQGADRAWGRYLNDNPIFDPKGKDFALNPSRKPWQQYFGKADVAQVSGPKRRIRVDAQGNILDDAPAGYKVLKFDAQGNRIE